MKKINKILTPIIGTSLVAGAAPFAAVSCANNNEDKKPETPVKAKLNLASTPANVDMQDEYTPLTIVNNTDKFFLIMPDNASGIGAYDARFRLGQKDEWVMDWTSPNEGIYLYPNMTIQLMILWNDEEKIGNFSTKDNKVTFSFVGFSDYDPETDGTIDIGGSLLSMFTLYDSEAGTYKCGTEIKTEYAFSELFTGNPENEYVTQYGLSLINSKMKMNVSSNLLPFKTLTAHCYDSMFKGCAGLQNAPSLPAETLTEGCYQNMFYGCEALETCGNIPANVVAKNCFNSMFYNCFNLKLISLGYVGNFTAKFFENWLTNAGTKATSCILRYNGLDTKDTASDLIPSNFNIIQDQNLIDNYTRVIEIKPDGATSQLSTSKNKVRLYKDLTFGDIENQIPDYEAITSGNVFKSWYKDDLTTALTIEDTTKVSDLESVLVPVYGVEEEDPQILPSHTTCVVEEDTTITVNEVGTDEDSSNIKYLKTNDDGSWPDYRVEENWNKLTPGTATPLKAGYSFALKGKLQTLNPLDTYTSISITGGKVRLGGDVMSLALNDDGSLPDPTVIPSDACFACLFRGSTGIVSVDPKYLPATTLKPWCYASMFNSCTNLTIAPELPAETAAGACYHWMFANCTKLQTVPSLKLTTLVDPVLPLKWDGDDNKTYNGVCDHMFCNCPALVNVPELLPTYVNDRAYSYMFNGCTSLTKAPKIHATEIADAKYHGLYGWDDENEEYNTLDLMGACNGMFLGCTALTDASEMWTTAPTNGIGCFYQMFYGATALTKAPVLSDSLKANCYYQMFYGATSKGTTSALAIYNGEASEGTSYKIFTCPSTIPDKAVTNMFYRTSGGYYKSGSSGNGGTPVAGETYYYQIV